MSTKPHKFWPSEGSTWQHWSDLLLATQLAAARAGFTGLSRDWHPARPDVLKVKCALKYRKSRERCRHAMLSAEPVDRNKPDEGWRVKSLQSEHLDSSRHPGHDGGLGLSDWLKPAVQIPRPSQANGKVAGWRFVSQVDQRMGPFPIFDREEEVTPFNLALPGTVSLETRFPQQGQITVDSPAPAHLPYAPSQTVPSSRLLKAETALISATSSLATAESTIARLKAELEAAEQGVEVKRKLVEKRRKKVERVREKEKVKSVKAFSSNGKSTSSALDKVKKKKKAQKEESGRAKKEKQR
ncbi:hypothetical protein JCM11251_003237 [Rhodosporidiobolus azoricus]